MTILKVEFCNRHNTNCEDQAVVWLFSVVLFGHEFTWTRYAFGLTMLRRARVANRWFGL